MNTKKLFSGRIIILLLSIFQPVSLISAQDNFKPSQNPPGNLEPIDVPQFITIGWDDNGFSDGMNWILDFLKTKKNPNNTMPKNVFYITAKYGADTANPDESRKVKEAWQRAYKEGHEIGNHTYSHQEGMAVWPQAQWEKTMDSCSLFLSQQCSIPRNRLGLSQQSLSSASIYRTERRAECISPKSLNRPSARRIHSILPMTTTTRSTGMTNTDQSQTIAGTMQPCFQTTTRYQEWQSYRRLLKTIPGSKINPTRITTSPLCDLPRPPPTMTFNKYSRTYEERQQQPNGARGGPFGSTALLGSASLRRTALWSRIPHNCARLNASLRYTKSAHRVPRYV